MLCSGCSLDSAAEISLPWTISETRRLSLRALNLGCLTKVALEWLVNTGGEHSMIKMGCECYRDGNLLQLIILVCDWKALIIRLGGMECQRRNDWQAGASLLQALLESPTVAKVGVDLWRDVLKVYESLQIRVCAGYDLAQTSLVSTLSIPKSVDPRIRRRGITKQIMCSLVPAMSSELLSKMGTVYEPVAWTTKRPICLDLGSSERKEEWRFLAHLVIPAAFEWFVAASTKDAILNNISCRVNSHISSPWVLDMAVEIISAYRRAADGLPQPHLSKLFLAAGWLQQSEDTDDIIECLERELSCAGRNEDHAMHEFLRHLISGTLKESCLPIALRLLFDGSNKASNTTLFKIPSAPPYDSNTLRHIDSNYFHDLDLFQQGALNAALDTDRSILLIEGPPGSGKTTVLARAIKVYYEVLRERIDGGSRNGLNYPYSKSEVPIQSVVAVVGPSEPSVMRIAQLLLNDGIDDFMIIVHPQFFNQSTGLRMKLSELILRRCYGFNDLRPFLFAQSPTGRFDSRSSWKAPEIPPIVLCPLSTLSVLADDVFYEIFGGKPLNGNDDQLWRNKNQKSGDLRRTTHVFIDEVSQIYVGHLAAPLTRIGMGREGVEKLCFFGDQGGIAPRGKQVTKTFRNVFHALHTRALQFPRFTVRRYFGRPGEIYASESSPIGPIRLFTQHRIPPLISKFIYREICGMSLYDALVFENENGKSPIQKRVERFLPEGASLGQLTIQEANRWDKLVFQNKAEQQEESILPLLFVLNRPHHPRNDLEFVNTLGSESRVEGPGRHSPKYIATFGASILFEHSPGSIQIVTEKNNTPVNQREWTFFNRMEAEVIMRLVLELAVGVVQLDIPIPRKANQLDNVLKVRMEDIAILTLYAGQREYIRRLFSEHLGTLPGACHPCLRVFTADEFLGQECKIGIISTVRTRGVDQLLRDQRRSTALLSRASEKVFVVGNADWFTGSVVADLQEDDDEDVLTNEITRKRDRNAQSTVFGMLAQLCVAGEKVLCACCIPKDRRADTRMYVDNSASFEDTSTGSSAIDLQINPCSEQNIDAMMEDYEVPAQKPSYDLVSCVVREGEGDEVDWDTEDDEIASNRLAAALDSVMLQPSVELDEGFDAEFEDHPGLWMQNGRGRMLTTARDLFGME